MSILNEKHWHFCISLFFSHLVVCRFFTSPDPGTEKTSGVCKMQQCVGRKFIMRLASAIKIFYLDPTEQNVQQKVYHSRTKILIEPTRPDPTLMWLKWADSDFVAGEAYEVPYCLRTKVHWTLLFSENNVEIIAIPKHKSFRSSNISRIITYFD